VNLLLDTHVFLWWQQSSGRLNLDVRRAIADPAHTVFISAATVWEIAVKRRLGKLTFHGSVVAAIGANGFHELPVLPVDAEAAGELAWDHADPFDRLLVAQAARHGMTLVTADRHIRSFGAVAQLWAET
jgi:PIN domain nuclease of toxin-antitoxin system